VESEDGPAAATIAELAARVRLAAGDPSGAAQLLGVAIAQRGTLDHGDPERKIKKVVKMRRIEKEEKK